MNARYGFSPARFWAMVVKEFVQMRRDRLTFGMMIGIPLLQLVLFGLAINSDPKHLPTAVLLADQGPQGRTLLSAIRNSNYFEFVRQVRTEAEGHDVLARGEVQFVINIPEDFSRGLLRGDRPAILLEADATDPAATISMAIKTARLTRCWIQSAKLPRRCSFSLSRMLWTWHFTVATAMWRWRAMSLLLRP
jgi:ABC-2 type transport system permease protein